MNKKIILSIFILIILLIFSTLQAIPPKIKILLIGLDGADWKVINPLIKEGKLPTFKKLIEEGCWGNLETIDPMSSEVIWTSIATSKTPQEHGITDKLLVDPYTKELIPATSNFIKVKRIWDILSSYNKKSLVVGYLITSPPSIIDGILISDRIEFASYLSKDYSYPEFTKFIPATKFYELTNLTDKGVMDIFSILKDGSLKEIEKNRVLFSLKNQFGSLISDRICFNFIDYLSIKYDFDLSVIYQEGSDKLQHLYWKYLFPKDFKNVSEREIKLFKDIIKDYYIYYDTMISKLIENKKESLIVMIVSDHGFKSEQYNEYIFDLNRILREILMQHPEIKLYQNKIQFIIEISAQRYKDKNIKISGLLTNEEFKKLKELLIESLNDIEILESGRHIFSFVRDTEFGFVVSIDMDYIIQFPLHTLILFDKEYRIVDFLKPITYSGTHDKYGIIIISGPNIKKNQKLETATIYDITPTILYLLGLPVAKDMKGKVLVEAIEDNFLKRNPTKYINTYENGKIKPILEGSFRSPKDEEKIKEKMRSVGYIQ